MVGAGDPPASEPGILRAHVLEYGAGGPAASARGAPPRAPAPGRRRCTARARRPRRRSSRRRRAAARPAPERRASGSGTPRAFARPARHWLLRLGDDQFRDALAEERQVRAGAAADFQDAPGCDREEPLTMSCEAGLLRGGHHAVVRTRPRRCSPRPSRRHSARDLASSQAPSWAEVEIRARRAMLAPVAGGHRVSSRFRTRRRGFSAPASAASGRRSTGQRRQPVRDLGDCWLPTLSPEGQSVLSADRASVTNDARPPRVRSLLSRRRRASALNRSDRCRRARGTRTAPAARGPAPPLAGNDRRGAGGR